MVVDLDRLVDNRGFFARSFCIDEFRQHGIDDVAIVQCNTSYNRTEGTVRGMHYQSFPCEESKVVCCNKGAMYDVVLDLRAGSATYGKWISAYLSDKNFRGIYIPKGCAHGYQTLVPDTVVMYMVTVSYSAEHSCTVSYKNYNIPWPLPVSVISVRDAQA